MDILIIDEISMVFKDLFSCVHWRFQQIKGNKKPFGGVSVLAVGDFYQLPPLGRAKPLCVYEKGVLDMWKENFQMVNLTQIMCQKDDLVFAELLNRVHVKQKTDVLSNEDKALLGQAVKDAKDCPPDVLHIFATNKEVDRHNAKIIAAHHPNTVDIKAFDFIKDPTTGGLVQISDFKGQRKDFLDTIQAAVRVRVMVTRNLDVEDGMVNGTFATIAHMVMVGQHDGEPVVRLLGLKQSGQSKCRTQKFVKKSKVLHMIWLTLQGGNASEALPNKVGLCLHVLQSTRNDGADCSSGIKTCV